MLISNDPISSKAASKRGKWKERIERNCDVILYDALKSKEEDVQKWALKKLNRKKEVDDVID